MSIRTKAIRTRAAALVLVTVSGLGAAAAAPAADAHAAISAWGTPNYCTYTSSVSAGWAGRHSVYYRSSAWSYNPNTGRVMKIHHTYEEYVAWSNPGHPAAGHFSHWCDR